MSVVTFVLLGIAYVALMVLILCILAGAKRSDEAVASYHEHDDGIARERVQG